MGIETKLAAARTRLVLDKPFLGALVLRLPLVAADPRWCPTIGTDARKLYYNADYIKQLTLDETQFMLAHEALHCALSHFARRQHRVQRRWDLACDFAINPLLVKDGLKPPPGVLVLDLFDGMSAEEIYPCLENRDDEAPLDKHLYDGDSGSGNGDHAETPSQGSASQKEQPATPQGASQPEDTDAQRPAPLNAAEREALAAQWQKYLAGAAQAAQAAGKLSGSLARLVDRLLQPQLPWRALLARYLVQSARDDYTYLRPSRREGELVLPSLRSAQLNVVAAIDISGSLSDEEIGEFLAEIDALKGQVRARVTLLACDAALAEGAPWIFEPWETLTPPRTFAGGGGTRFAPVFEWVAQHGSAPDTLLYFTDAEGEFPPVEPPYPVVWLVKGKAPVPWGQRIQLN